jgi:hypothetical protein
VTVCIAAISQDGYIFAIADRLVTAGDVEFEPPAPKIFPITSSIYLMNSDDDASLSAEIYHEFRSNVEQLIMANPEVWLEVTTIVDIYLRYSETFISRQNQMNTDFITAISEQIINYQLPRTSAIVCGFDNKGPHIFVIHDNDCGCYDDIGFASIGMGASHANSQFMLHGHTRWAPTADTVFLTYLAKKRSEIAPGVGDQSDTLLISGLGQSSTWNPALIARLEEEYQKLIREEKEAQSKAKEEIGGYVAELQRGAAAAQAAPQLPDSQEANKPDEASDPTGEGNA